MKIVTNPTENGLSIQYKGVVYTLGAGESKNLPEDVAVYWKTMIHAFLLVKDGSAVQEEPKAKPELDVVPEEAAGQDAEAEKETEVEVKTVVKKSKKK